MVNGLGLRLTLPSVSRPLRTAYSAYALGLQALASMPAAAVSKRACAESLSLKYTKREVYVGAAGVANAWQPRCSVGRCGREAVGSIRKFVFFERFVPSALSPLQTMIRPVKPWMEECFDTHIILRSALLSKTRK